MMKRKLIVALSVIFALSLSVLCFASCSGGNAEKPKYTISFETDGGSVVEAQQVERGSKVTKPDDPTKDGYAFAGWYLGEEEYDFSAIVRSKLTLTAKWTVVVYFEITWKDEDGTVLATDNVAEGTTPAYDGETPTKDATAQYTYIFNGWTPVLTAVTEDAEYTATYSETLRTYDILWKNEDGTLLYTGNAAYGTIPTYSGETPEKASTTEHDYVHNGWTPAVEAVAGEATYTATYEETARKYTVTFMNGEDVLVSEKYEYGAMPAYDGTPTKDATAQYTYTFSGWDKEIAAVTGDVTYTAQYSETYIDYTVTFIDYNGDTMSEKTDYHYGDALIVPDHSVLAGYTFDWDAVPTETCTGNATYTETKTANTDTAYTVRHHFAMVSDPASASDYTVIEEAAEGTTDATTAVVAREVSNHTSKDFEQQVIAGDGSTVVDVYYDVIDASKLSLYLIDTSALTYTGASSVAVGGSALVIAIPQGTADAVLNIPLPASWEYPLMNYADITTLATTYTSATPEQWNCQWVGYQDAEGNDITYSFINTAGSYSSVTKAGADLGELPACVIKDGGNLYLRVYVHYHTGIWLGMNFAISEITLGEPIDPNRTTLNFNVDTVTATNNNYLDVSKDTIQVRPYEGDYWIDSEVTVALPASWEDALKAGAAISAKVAVNRVLDSNIQMAFYKGLSATYINAENSYVTLSASTEEAGTLPTFVTKEDGKLYLHLICRNHFGWGSGSVIFTITEVSLKWATAASLDTGTLQWGYGDYDTYYNWSGALLSTGAVRSNGYTQQYAYYKYVIGRNKLTFKVANYNFDVANSLLRIKLEYNNTVYSYDQTNHVWKDGSGNVNNDIKMYNDAGDEVYDLSAFASDSGLGEYVTFVITGITESMSVIRTTGSAYEDDTAGLKIISAPPTSTVQGGADSYVCLYYGTATWDKV